MEKITKKITTFTITRMQKWEGNTGENNQKKLEGKTGKNKRINNYSQ